MGIGLGTKSLWQAIVDGMDLVLTCKELFLKLTVTKKEAKSLKTALCGIAEAFKYSYYQNCSSLFMFSNFRRTIILGTPTSECFSLCLNVTPKKTQVISENNLWVYIISYQLLIIFFQCQVATTLHPSFLKSSMHLSTKL